MTFSNSPRPERRTGDRRTGSDRRGTERRVVVDRRYAPDRRSQSMMRQGIETPIEHIRNAMQLLLGAVESEAALTSDDFARRAEAALERLTRALSSLEAERRR
jgi:hypothetical protein